MTSVVASVLAAAVALALPERPATCARARLDRILPGPPSAPRSAPVFRFPAHRVAATIAGLALVLLIGGLAGVLVGLPGAVLVDLGLVRLEPRAVRERRRRILADLPTAADLLAACLIGGCPPTEAVRVVADALGGPLGVELETVVATQCLGGDQVSSWARLADDPLLAPLARAWVRALDTGAPLADTMTRLAEERRADRRWSAESHARRAGVRAVAPLGLCFLPAFVLIGVVPTVVATARDLLV